MRSVSIVEIASECAVSRGQPARFYFEGGGYSNRNENRIDIHGGPFVVGRIMLRF
jgi:hypothetical protein